jgi:Family of unknown function (DUF6370)
MPANILSEVKGVLADRHGAGRCAVGASMIGGCGMRMLFGLFLAFAVTLTLWTGAQGSQDKDSTIKGTVTCAKCDLKVAGQTKCATVVVEKKNGKDVIYYFDADSGKKFHGNICTEPKAGTVTGVVSDKDGKKTVAAKDVVFDKK